MEDRQYIYPLSDDTWGREEIEAALEVLISRRFTMGQKTLEFEAKFAEWCGSKHAIMVNSGSSANLLLFAALVYSGRLQPGDEVIVPAVSWSTTYFPLFQHGLTLRFVDIDRSTLNLDPALVEAAITERTKAVFAVNLLGNACYFDELRSICKKNNLILLEDNCEALGAKYKGQLTGTLGLAGTFSTFYSHHICTMEGGVVVTDDSELNDYMLSIRAHGWTRNLSHNSSLYVKKEDPFYERFNFIMPGYNLRPLEIEAAIGIKQIDRIGSIISQRRRNAEYFTSKMKELPLFETQKDVDESSWFGFPIIITDPKRISRDEVVSQLEKNGIETRPIVAGNFVKNKAIDYMNYSIYGTLENADYVHENGFFVGNHSSDNERRIRDLAAILKEQGKS